MTRRELLEEQYEDALFALLMDDVAISEGQKAIEENERLKSDPSAAVSLSAQQKCIQTINQYFWKKNVRSACHVTGKIINRVALVALIGMLLVSTAFAFSPTFRVNALNLMIETLGDRTNFQFSDGDSAVLPSINLNWIPEGFELTDQNTDSTVEWVQYMNSKQDMFDIMLMEGTGSIASFDTENADVSDLTIGQQQATMIEKKDTKQIVWGDQERNVFVQIRGCNITTDTLIKIAENLILE
ncbi:DUF4367 domain-containing protein [Oscillibacter sp.]|uniref:DUF4367 domain-containing protein n=1 Tax=Oscillibacter sp. TaxID=1945593 RepID=UPI0028AB8162|nr:DUF4367 domain-containing protein [Oscillibacter sp.]